MSPRSLSTTAEAAIFAQQTGEVPLVLAVISHASMTDLYFVNDTQDVTTGGDTYTACPFSLRLPHEDGEQLPRAQISIPNVSRDVITGVRSLTSPPTITLSVVLASDPSTVEMGPLTFQMREIEYDAAEITATLHYEPLLEEPYPGRRFTPALFPGLF